MKIKMNKLSSEVIDKNGQVIFDGDIIVDGYKRVMEVYYCKRHLRWEVKECWDNSFESFKKTSCDFVEGRFFEWVEEGKTDAKVISNK